MSKIISLLVIGATVAAGLALPAVATAGGSMGGNGTGGTASGRLSGFGGASGGGSGGAGQGGFAAPAGAESGSMAAGSGQALHRGSSASMHGNTHSHGDGKEPTAGFGAAAQGTASPARGAKPVVVTGTGAGVSSSHLAHGASFAGDLSGHHHHGHFHHHAIPFLFFTGVGTIPAVTATPATEAEDESQSFAVSNQTDSEMTVLDNGVRLCVLAPKARCSFATTGGHHDFSVRIGGKESSGAAGPGAHGGHMIEVGKEAD